MSRMLWDIERKAQAIVYCKMHDLGVSTGRLQLFNAFTTCKHQWLKAWCLAKSYFCTHSPINLTISDLKLRIPTQPKTRGICEVKQVTGHPMSSPDPDVCSDFLLPHSPAMSRSQLSGHPSLRLRQRRLLLPVCHGGEGQQRGRRRLQCRLHRTVINLLLPLKGAPGLPAKTLH